MTGNVLDGLPAWSWFLGLDVRTASYIIATLGIIHPTAYIYSCFVHHSWLFITIWVLVAFWSMFSIGLFVGIFQGMHLALECWVWYTFIFAPLMIILTAMLAGYCCCQVRAPLCTVLAVILVVCYYWVTIYFIFVVNSLRMKEFS